MSARAASLAWILALSACRPTSQPAEIPSPSLAGMEAEVIEAITAAREALVHEPDSAKTWGRLGDQYFVHDLSSSAVTCYAMAQELDPESFVWPYRLGLSLMLERPELALAPLERSASLLGNYAPALEAYAKVLVLTGRSDEALPYYERASTLDRASPVAETGLGMIHLARCDFEPARRHLEEALARDGRHVEAHAALAQVSLALGLDKKAQRHAELSRALPPSRQERDAIATPNLPPAGARARTRHGRQLEELGRTQEAVKQYRAALASNPDYYQARRSLASLLVDLGQREEAIALLREAKKSNPAFEAASKDLAKLMAAEGRLEREEAAER